MDQQQLKQILAYSNEDVLSRFTDQFTITEEEAEDLFRETRKFLYLCQLPGIFIPDELLILDEMWHNFILFTKEYHRFCEEHFGRYFHHLPATKKEKEIQRTKNELDPEGAKAEFQVKLSHIMGHVYDEFGAETLIKWFKIYPIKYSKENISSLRKY